jgi:hypothetical protein
MWLFAFDLRKFNVVTGFCRCGVVQICELVMVLLFPGVISDVPQDSTRFSGVHHVVPCASLLESLLRSDWVLIRFMNFRPLAC